MVKVRKRLLARARRGCLDLPRTLTRVFASQIVRSMSRSLARKLFVILHCLVDCATSVCVCVVLFSLEVPQRASHILQ